MSHIIQGSRRVKLREDAGPEQRSERKGYAAGLEDGGRRPVPRSVGSLQEPEKARTWIPPPELPEGMPHRLHFGFIPVRLLWTSDLLNCQRINWCCLQALSLWSSVTGT